MGKKLQALADGLSANELQALGLARMERWVPYRASGVVPTWATAALAKTVVERLRACGQRAEVRSSGKRFEVWVLET